jgi:hypothetical protein
VVFTESSAIQPIAVVGSESKTGVKLTPPSVERHSPPLASPTNSRPRACGSTAKVLARPVTAVSAGGIEGELTKAFVIGSGPMKLQAAAELACDLATLA